MKKAGLLRYTGLLLALILAISMAECGSKSPSELIVGRWVFEEDPTSGFEFFADGDAIGFIGNNTDEAN